MGASKTTPPLYSLVLFHALLLVTSTADDSDPQLYHICSSASAASSNPSKLLRTLSTKAASTGFATASSDSEDSSSYGLALCRGDVSPSGCKSCLSGVATSLVDLCLKSRAGIVWYDNCLLKYSDSDFFGHVDYENKFYLYNVMNISSHPELFTKTVREMLTELSKEAAGAGHGTYAAAQETLDTFTTLYGMVQCTRDLTPDDCRRCLDEAVSELGSCCHGKQGGRVVGGSCNFRYEIYPFLNSD